VAGSYHATAGQILDSQDAYLAHVAAGNPVAILGCESCHGTKVEIDPKAPNRLARNSWPNSGIGRINPDGSLGACNACHTRHTFAKAQARQPEACSKCHLGPDHPQKEVYEESKHGNTYFTNQDLMNLDSSSWVVGVDYSAAPTCATCHMSATTTQKVTHDVGQRIAWTLRPPISKHKDGWQGKQANMQNVCVACHGQSFSDGHFYQFDASVRLYNEKFARPATELIELVRARGLLENPASFSNKIEWTYWELWHHEGRRARHGASMMGPDYTWFTTATCRTKTGNGSRTTAIGSEHSYNNAGAGTLWNGVSDRPVIADPELTEMSQVHISLTSPAGLRLRLGRQAVNLDNQRHVGAVGWRQHHQTFEAVRIDVTQRRHQGHALDLLAALKPRLLPQASCSSVSAYGLPTNCCA
jgi:hypothetical protein